MRTLGFIIGLLGVLHMIFDSTGYSVSYASVFFDSIGFYGLVVIFIGITLGTRNFKTLIAGINGALSDKYHMTTEQRDKTVDFFKLLRTTALYYSVMLVFIGFVQILLNLDEPLTLGPKLAIALTPVVWSAIIIMLIFNPAIYMLLQKQTLDESTPGLPVLDVRAKGNQISFRSSAPIKDKDAAEKLLQLCFEKGITHEEIMEADDITLRRKM